MVVAVTMNTMKNAFQVVNGKKSRTELTDELLRDLFVSSSALGLGTAGQVILPQLPVVGYLVGSFVGSIVGTFVYNTGYKAALFLYRDRCDSVWFGPTGLQTPR